MSASHTSTHPVEPHVTKPLLDTFQTLETPENIDLELHLAGPFVRIIAFSIDIAIRLGIQIIAFMVLSYFDKIGMAAMMILMFLLEWLYPVYFEVFHAGMTPGKKAKNIRVIHDDGTPIGWSSSIIRNLLRFVDFLPFGYIFGLVTMCSNRHFKRMGDFTAGTLVVYQQTASTHPPIPNDKPLPSPIPLTLKEQRALLSYAERLHNLSADRQRELANHLSSVTNEKDNDAVVLLVRIANWLRGTR